VGSAVDAAFVLTEKEAVAAGPVAAETTRRVASKAAGAAIE
jgi:hypothetical protein